MSGNSSTTMDQALAAYEETLVALQEAGGPPATERILDVMLARDQVKAALIHRSPGTRAALQDLHRLDDTLRRLSKSEATFSSVSAWRNAVQPEPEDWWWYLEPPEKEHWSVRLNWLWNSMAVVWLLTTLFLIFELAPRFPNVGPDTLNTIVQLGQLSIAILAAGGALTLAGRKLIDNSLLALRIPQKYLRTAKALLAVMVVSGLIWLRLSLPAIASFYNNRGVQRHHEGALIYALHDYRRALNLVPDFAEVHYNLGLLYEDLGDYAQAEAEYRYAIEGDLDLAYVNLSRLYILAGKLSQATSLLEVHLLEAEEADVRYDMLKNLGWARVGQARYDEAVFRLQQAVELLPDKAPAHCLLAQAYEGLAASDLALAEWEACLALASVYRPDEDTWLGMAKQRLDVQ